MRLRNLCLALAAGSALAACSTEDLGVSNLTDPDVARSLSTPDGIEAILKNGFQQMFTATATSGSLTPAAEVAAFESYGSVANYNMNVRGGIPRSAIDNQRGNATATENFRDFQQLSLRARTVDNALIALDQLIANGGSLGSTAQNLRGRAFGFFALGLGNGKLALMYDSVGVITTDLATSDIPPLVGYQEAMQVALNQLDSAIAMTQASMAAGTFSLDEEWLRTTDAPIGGDRFLQIVHSLKARLMAGVARTPAERAAVDWAKVAQEASAGITSDVVLALNSGLGWSYSWLSQMYATEDAAWHQMPNWIIGMADTTSGYQTWLNTPFGSRAPFRIQTPDTRFPSGDTDAAQRTNSPDAGADLPSTYFAMRTSTVYPGEPYGNSQYVVARFRRYRANGGDASWVWMSATEISMLRAEALLRSGSQHDAGTAVTLVNASRTAHGLAPFPAGADSATQAPAQAGGGATSCVPRTPTAASTTLQCGTLFEAMKWEKRMETVQTGYVQWFIDSRGWGDLPEGTTLMWPVPYQEMDARREAFYDAMWQAGPMVSYKLY
jgi:hypothetical protein